jgi:CBS domain-containing protein
MNLPEKIGTILKSKGRQVWSVPPTASVFEAIEAMAEKQVGALPVMEGDKLVGIISERDYARKIILMGRSSRETPVTEIMSSPVLTVTPENTIGECMVIITEHRIRHLPVVDHDRVVGVVSIGDLVNWIISVQPETIKQLESYITEIVSSE